MCFGKRIKTYLDDSGIKYSAISQRTGIPLNTLSTMLNGKRKITIEEYISICNALEKSYNFFASDEEMV